MSEASNKLRLANIYLEQADVSRQQRNIDDSVRAFTRAIDIYKKLAEEEPGCYELVADTIEKVAATYKAAGMLHEAENTFKEAAQLREAIAKRSEAEGEET